jgi:tricorn protease-like protein
LLVLNTFSTSPSISTFPFEPLDDSFVVLAIDENSYTHLFAYQPGRFPIYRLTTGEWHDIHPAISPNGKMLAFSSNRDRYWELYTLDLETGQSNRITFSPEFDGAPAGLLMDCGWHETRCRSAGMILNLISRSMVRRNRSA